MTGEMNQGAGDRRNEPAAWPAGVSAVVAAVVAGLVVTIDGRGTVGAEFTVAAPAAATVYGVGPAVLTVALLVSGLMLLWVRHPLAVTTLLGLAVLCAAQLAGTGLVARRRWPLYRGCCTEVAITRTELVRGLAVGMAVACALAAVVCVVVLVRRGLVRRPGLDLRSGVAFVSALLVAVLGSLLADADYGHDVAAWALMYGVPFAVTLALTALVPRTAGAVLAAGVAASALLANAGTSFMELRLPWDGALPLVLVASAVAGVGLMLPGGVRSPAQDHAPSHSPQA